MSTADSTKRLAPDDPRGAHLINFSWLIQLRWGAVIGQAALIGYTTAALDMSLPLGALGAILATEALLNVGVSLWVRRDARVTEAAIAGSLAVDVLAFTGLLYLTGGPMNPFSFLYLVHIALAAVVLRPRWAWALVLLSLAGSASLFFFHVPLPDGMHGGHGGGGHHGHHGHHMAHHGSGGGEPFDLHLRGMWVAFAVAAAFIVYFIHRVTGALRDREAELLRARELAARTEKLAAMATLAAGAAHELGTPLATIAVVAKELERLAPSERTVEDVRLIRDQVERCRGILSLMAEGAAARPGEATARTSLGELVRLTLVDVAESERVRVEWGEGVQDLQVVVPIGALSQSLRNLVKNGLDASNEKQEVRLLVTAPAGEPRFEVVDAGSGMDAEVLARATEPFFTTKEPGKGMGLGLFLSRSVVELLGGILSLSSVEGKGTRVVVQLPATVTRDNASHGPSVEA